MPSSRSFIVAALLMAVLATMLASKTTTAPLHYNSFMSQMLQYMARPHRSVRRWPITGAAAWTAEDMRCDQTKDDGAACEWLSVLSTDEREEILEGVAYAEATMAARWTPAMAQAAATANADTVNTNSFASFAAVPRERLALLRADDCSLKMPSLKKRIASEWRVELSDIGDGGAGRGFHVLRGVPTEAMSQAESETFFWCFGLLFGRPGAQNKQDDLLGHVRDTMTASNGDVGSARLFRTNTHAGWHCDAASVVGLLCLSMAKDGGVSQLASSVSVYNELLKTKPHLVDCMYEATPMQVKEVGADGVRYIDVFPARYDGVDGAARVDGDGDARGGALRTFFHSEYFLDGANIAVELNGGEAPSVEWIRAVDALASSDELKLEMRFLPGDLQLVSNHVTLHARTAFTDGDADGEMRHLLRLWLSLADTGGLTNPAAAATWTATFVNLEANALFATSIIRAKVRAAARKLRSKLIGS
jgi:hypothetical protein